MAAVLLYSFDCNEPMHVHAERNGLTCKFWLAPLTLASSHGFKPHELGRIQKTIASNFRTIKNAWDRHCTRIYFNAIPAQGSQTRQYRPDVRERPLRGPLRPSLWAAVAHEPVESGRALCRAV
ncbi:MAG: DUF4160 domain-containing protein [Gemmatimonadota bacterium]